MATLSPIGGLRTNSMFYGPTNPGTYSYTNGTPAYSLSQVGSKAVHIACYAPSFASSLTVDVEISVTSRVVSNTIRVFAYRVHINDGATEIKTTSHIGYAETVYSGSGSTTRTLALSLSEQNFSREDQLVIIADGTDLQAPNSTVTIKSVNADESGSGSGGTSDPGSGSGSGTGGGGSSSASDIVTATPSSPTGGASVTAGEDTEFRWSLSTRISGADDYGTELQYRTSSTGSAMSLGSALAGYRSYTKTGGFSSASDSMYWRARAKIFVSDSAFSASGYTVEQIEASGCTIQHYDAGQEISTDSGGLFNDETTSEAGYLIIGKWSSWAAFSVIAATRPTASASPSSPVNSESVVAGEPVEFKWSLSKTGDGSYNGTQIHWRYEGTSNWTLIDAARAGIETYIYEDGFFPNKTVEWEARAKLDNSWGEWSETATFLVDAFPKAVASPSSPDGSTSVSGHAAVEFKWSLSKTGGTAAFDGSQLQYRYLGSNIWTDLASVVAGITTYTFFEGFEPNSTVLWRVRAKLADANGEWGEWSEEKSFSVGSEYIFETTVKIVAPKSGNRNGGDSIVFAYDIQTSGTVTASQVEYSTDEGINWETLTTIEGRETEIRFSVSPLKFPSGTINWRVRAKANGDYSDWVEASFTVKYDAHGAIKMTNGPVNVGVLGSIPILFQGEMEREGISPDDILLSDAQLYWKSGSASEFSSIPMSIFGSRASIQVPEDTFPTGLLQWYIRAKDSTNTESETKIFTAYVLASYADSFAIDPISVVKNAEDEILFQWGYIMHNGQATVKTEIQFSTDGVDWDSPITVYEAGG